MSCIFLKIFFSFFLHILNLIQLYEITRFYVKLSDADDYEPPKASTNPKIADRWDGEDEDDDVKDSWDKVINRGRVIKRSAWLETLPFCILLRCILSMTLRNSNLLKYLTKKLSSKHCYT